MADKVITTDGPCACCGGCALTVAGAIDSPSDGVFVITEDFFTLEAQAAAYLASAAVVGCWLAAFQSDPDTGQSGVVTLTGSIVGQLYSFSGTSVRTGGVNVAGRFYTKVFITAAGGLTYNTTISAGAGFALLAYDAAGSVVYFDVGTVGGSHAFPVTVPSDGYYTLMLFFNSADGTTSVSYSADFTLEEGATHCLSRVVYGTDAGDPDTWEYLMCEE